MNQIFTHPGQPEMQAEVILASKAKDCPSIYTVRLRYPRIIHAEIMTHRVFSRNARSSRAVPVKTMLDEVRNIPFVPWHWGKNQKGMQAGEECSELVELHGWTDYDGEGSYIEGSWVSREEAWKRAAFMAVYHAEAFAEAGYHKQIANRLLEPFSWIDTLITATDWANFLHLRDHKDAEPHLQDLARLVKQAIDNTEIQERKPGEWHLPYITQADLYAIPQHLKQSFVDTEFARRISAARCARISYAPFDGDPSYKRELERYDQLVKSDRVHASPLEHQATPDTITYARNYRMDGEFRAEVISEGLAWSNTQLHGNLTGWIQYRKTVPGEAVHG